MQLRKAFKAAGFAAAAALVAGAAIVPAATTLTHFDRANTRFATCLAQQTGGESNRLLGTVTDLEGKTVYHDPVIRTYGTEILGRRAGAIIADVGGASNYLTATLKADNKGGHATAFDYVRLAGIPVLSKTWGRGNLTPHPAQTQLGAYVDICANSGWVLHN